MEKKNDGVDYDELIARAVKKDPAIREIMESQRDTGVDYGEEYRKQTGRDFETGEIVVQ